MSILDPRITASTGSPIHRIQPDHRITGFALDRAPSGILTVIVMVSIIIVIIIIIIIIVYIQGLKSILKRTALDGQKLDGIIIETTGLYII